MTLPCCYVAEDKPDKRCEARRLKDLPMCQRHLLRTFRDALEANVLPDDVFRELVQQTDWMIQARARAAEREDDQFIAQLREERLATYEAKRRGEGSVVYYVQLTGGRIKIGRTADIAQRLATFRATAADLLAIEPGGYEVETARHRQFAHLRIGRSEDFRVDATLARHIESLREKGSE